VNIRLTRSTLSVAFARQAGMFNVQEIKVGITGCSGTSQTSSHTVMDEQRQ